MKRHYCEQSDELKERLGGRLFEQVYGGIILMCLGWLKKLTLRFLGGDWKVQCYESWLYNVGDSFVFKKVRQSLHKI